MTVVNDSRDAEFGWPGGDQPGALTFAYEVVDEVAEAILATLQSLYPGLDRDRAEVRLLTEPDGFAGRYRVCAPGQQLFVRIGKRWGDPQMEQSITAHLQDCGVAVNHLEVAGVCIEFGRKKYRLDVRKLVDGRHFNGALDDLALLAGCVASCHAAMRQFPLAAEIQKKAKLRFDAHVNAREQIRRALERRAWSYFSTDSHWAIEHADWLSEMAQHYAPRFDLLPGAQGLHAQIHRANVIYRNSDGMPVLVDFEEAVHTFAPVSWDLAYFVQRFCLFDNPMAEELLRRLSCIRVAYGEWVPGLSEMMRQTAWLSMVTIIHRRQFEGVVTPAAEYEKFVRLERQARELSAVIDGGGLAAS